MDEKAPSLNSPNTKSPGNSLGRDLLLLLILLIAASGIRAWLITHTEVTARDGVGFIRYAWQLRLLPWKEVMRQNQHPPLYPMTILGMSYPVRHYFGADNLSASMQLSAQLANSLAGMLLVIPMFYLGKRLFNSKVGFWSALLFQCLPVGSRVVSDALSEGVYLLATATALVLAWDALKYTSKVRYFLCGVCAGLAFLTRPEGMLILGAVTLVLLGMQTIPADRRPWRQVVPCVASLGLGAILVGLPYMVTIGGLTNKTTGLSIMKTVAVAPEKVLPPGTTMLASPVAIYWSDIKDSPQLKRLAWGLKAVGGEIVKGFHYAPCLLALLGLWWFRGRLRAMPGANVLLALCLVHFLVLWRVAYVAGYVAERHSLIFVLCGLPWAVAAVFRLGELLSGGLTSLVARRMSIPERATHSPLWESSTLWSLVVLVGVTAVALPKTLEPLHTNRAGYHAAGLWLATHANPNDIIIDPFCWSEYYSGHVFREGFASKTSNDFQPTRYVVLGGSDNEHARLPLIPEAEQWAARGTLVYHWPTSPPKVKAEKVMVYRVPPSGQ